MRGCVEVEAFTQYSLENRHRVDFNREKLCSTPIEEAYNPFRT